MKKTTAVPRSSATNAYDLCRDVKRAILEEPKRLNMTFYAQNDIFEQYGYDSRAPAGAPTCGTVGCFAGWVTMLAGGSASDACMYSATAILGAELDYRVVPSRENDGNNSVFNDGSSLSGVFARDIEGNIGTRRYARSVARRISGFMARNEQALKAQPINRPTKETF